MLRIDPNAQRAPAALVPWGLASFIVLLCANAIVTTLIVVRIWQLSPRKRCDMLGANFQRETGRAAIIIIVESGMLYLVVQFFYCILFAIHHPAQDIVGGIAMQVYVSIRYLKRRSMWAQYSNYTGHRTDTDFHPDVQLIEFARRTDS